MKTFLGRRTANGFAAAIVTALSLTLGGLTPSIATEPSEPSEPVCSADQLANCINGTSTGVTSGENLQNVVGGLAAVTEAGEQEDLRAGVNSFRHDVGMAAGGLLSGFGLWGSLGYTDFDGEPVFGPNVTRFSGDLTNVLLGADVAMGRFIFGVGLGFEHTGIKTDYNGGKQKSDGFTIVPYLLVAFNNYLSIDAAVGYTSLDNEQDRLNPADASNIAGDFDSSRIFGAANLNANYFWDNWSFGGQVGVVRVIEDQDGYTETGVSNLQNLRAVTDRSVSLTQGHASLDAGYSMGDVEPYVRVGYYHDFSRRDGQGVGGLPGGSVRTSFDKNEWRFAVGTRFQLWDWLRGSLELETEQGRKDFDSVSAMFTMRADL